MDDQLARTTPAGRPIRLRDDRRVIPQWVARRRRAYRLIDSLAAGAKHLVRRWLVRRPGGRHGGTQTRPPTARRLRTDHKL
jgi:hypothetical protein